MKYTAYNLHHHGEEKTTTTTTGYFFGLGYRTPATDFLREQGTEGFRTLLVILRRADVLYKLDDNAAKTSISLIFVPAQSRYL